MVLVANDDLQDRFLTLISTSNYKVIGKIKLDGSDPNGDFMKATYSLDLGGIHFLGAIGQCQWSSVTGKFYVVVPEVNGPGDNSASGVALVIDPTKMNVTAEFIVDRTQCVGPRALAISPNPQILLGCTGVGAPPYASPLSATAPGSVVISAIDGSNIFGPPGLNGVSDQVWYNATDNSYFIAAALHTDATGFTPLIAVVDAPDGEIDQTIQTFDDYVHSIAVDPSASRIVYVLARLLRDLSIP